jgi:hypothetical protein
MTRLLVSVLLLCACADRPLPDTSTGSGGSGGAAGSGGGAGSAGAGGAAGVPGDASIPDAAPDGARLSCGQIVQCGLGCGQNLQCFQMCCQMGSRMSCEEAQALVVCAVQNCSTSLGNPLQLLQCLKMSCP